MNSRRPPEGTRLILYGYLALVVFSLAARTGDEAQMLQATVRVAAYLAFCAGLLLLFLTRDDKLGLRTSAKKVVGKAGLVDGAS